MYVLLLGMHVQRSVHSLGCHEITRIKISAFDKGENGIDSRG